MSALREKRVRAVERMLVASILGAALAGFWFWLAGRAFG